MKDYIIMTDSCADLGKDIRKKYEIEYIPMNIVYNDKEEIASLDWDIYSPKELYDIMRRGTRIITNQVPQVRFEKEFEKHLQSNKDILYIACSSALSGSYQTSQVVKKELLLKYPDRKIYCIDSLNSSLGEGLMTIDAALMRENRKTIDEVKEYLEENKLCYNQLCTVDSLSYLKKAGRVKASSAFFGNLLGVKPILISNKNGENVAIKKVKGRNASLDEIVNMAKEVVINPQEQIIAIAHADCEEDAQYLKKRIQEELKTNNIYMNYIGPIIGASAGPGTIAIYVKGKMINI